MRKISSLGADFSANIVQLPEVRTCTRSPVASASCWLMPSLILPMPSGPRMDPGVAAAGTQKSTALASAADEAREPLFTCLLLAIEDSHYRRQATDCPQFETRVSAAINTSTSPTG